MKKLILLLLIILLGWDAFWFLIMDVKPIFPWQLEEELKKKHPDLVLLDVRTPEEFHRFHLPGAKNVPLGEGLAKDFQIPKTKIVVVICMTGHRSAMVAYQLQKESFKRAYNLAWGMMGWEVWKWLENMVTWTRQESTASWTEMWFSSIR